jgi:hypothetical protein
MTSKGSAAGDADSVISGGTGTDIKLGGSRGQSKSVTIEDVLNGYSPGRELAGAFVALIVLMGILTVFTLRGAKVRQLLFFV